MQQNLSLQSTLHYEPQEQRHFSGCQPLNFPSIHPTLDSSSTQSWPSDSDCSSHPNSYFNCRHHCGQFLSCSHSCHFKQQRETKSIPLPPLSFHQSSVCWHLQIMPAYPPCGCVSPHSISSILSLDSFLEFRVCCKSREEAPMASYVSFHSSFPLGNWLCFRGGHCKV